MSDLRQRDVVNINDGKRLGTVADVDVDPESGRIVALIVPGTGKFMGFFGGANDYVITWDRIVRIGPDVILVDWEDRERGGGRGGSRHRGESGPGNPGPGGFPPGMMPPGFGGMGGPQGLGGMPPGAGHAGPPGGPHPGGGPVIIPGPASMGGPGGMVGPGVMGGPLPQGLAMPQGMTTGGPLMPPGAPVMHGGPGMPPGIPVMPGGMMPGGPGMPGHPAMGAPMMGVPPGPPQDVEPDQERRRRPR